MTMRLGSGMLRDPCHSIHARHRYLYQYSGWTNVFCFRSWFALCKLIPADSLCINHWSCKEEVSKNKYRTNESQKQNYWICKHKSSIFLFFFPKKGGLKVIHQHMPHISQSELQIVQPTKPNHL
ncbi:hypothetical protein Pst134EA_018982 [Puccinia striiformis f. sp. tritici]|uniref:hypothetical protein n=1 Tax=Puccinia striiformis f. sp. tritici TaxID=168172 RepID=UPI002007A491|nr:hypothetical protein Pst134EA_018982 [Puccinia striiformis f. sp. tritici]KAH9458827.1 hypothetical protein Pst134EA_018982 [Puccinia striiformis f. sp. tritici]